MLFFYRSNRFRVIRNLFSSAFFLGHPVYLTLLIKIHVCLFWQLELYVTLCSFSLFKLLVSKMENIAVIMLEFKQMFHDRVLPKKVQMDWQIVQTQIRLS